MLHFSTQFFKNFLYLNFYRIFLIVSLLSMHIPAYAVESIWYSDKDLKEESISRIPQGYLDASTLDPCGTRTYDKPLSLVDVTEAALCHNPQTREVYANAKVQAAQVGVARSL